MEDQRRGQSATSNEQLRRGVCHTDRKGRRIVSWENSSLDFVEFNKHKGDNVPNSNFKSQIFIKNRFTLKNSECEQRFSSLCAAYFQKAHTSRILTNIRQSLAKQDPKPSVQFELLYERRSLQFADYMTCTRKMWNKKHFYGIYFNFLLIHIN